MHLTFRDILNFQLQNLKMYLKLGANLHFCTYRPLDKFYFSIDTCSMINIVLIGIILNIWLILFLYLFTFSIILEQSLIELLKDVFRT